MLSLTEPEIQTALDDICKIIGALEGSKLLTEQCEALIEEGLRDAVEALKNGATEEEACEKAHLCSPQKASAVSARLLCA